MLSFLYRFFHPTIDAFVTLSISFITRLRLLCLQPISLLIYALGSGHKLYRDKSDYYVYDIPTRHLGRPRRCLIYNAIPKHITKAHHQSPDYVTGRDHKTNLRPLHVDIHGGAWIGGFPEQDHEFCSQLARTTSAVVVSASYRFAPRYPFPAAIEDIDDITSWLLDNAEEVLGANVRLLTLSGFSAGANLALATSQGQRLSGKADTRVKGAVISCSAIDLRIPPHAKPRPPNFPKIDPLSFLEPLFDAYAAPARAKSKDDPRLNPILTPLESLPQDILMIIPKIDILLHEEQTLLRRVEDEIKQENKRSGSDNVKRSIRGIFFEKGFHGWLQLPSFIVGDADKKVAFGAACDFIIDVHRKHGYHDAP